LASSSDVNGSTESFEMVIEEASTDLATKPNSGKMLILCNFIKSFLELNFSVKLFIYCLIIYSGVLCQCGCSREYVYVLRITQIL
jgi:hypothetical protein